VSWVNGGLVAGDIRTGNGLVIDEDLCPVITRISEAGAMKLYLVASVQSLLNLVNNFRIDEVLVNLKIMLRERLFVCHFYLQFIRIHEKTLLAKGQNPPTKLLYYITFLIKNQ